jgi:hypothetical protein
VVILYGICWASGSWWLGALPLLFVSCLGMVLVMEVIVVLTGLV